MDRTTRRYRVTVLTSFKRVFNADLVILREAEAVKTLETTDVPVVLVRVISLILPFHFSKHDPRNHPTDTNENRAALISPTCFGSVSQ